MDDSEDTQLLRMKRKYDACIAREASFTSLRHNLLGDFENAELTGPVKSPRLNDHYISSNISRNSVSRFTEQSQNGTSNISRNSASRFSEQSQSDSPSLNRQMRLKESEIASLKERITKMENRITAIQRDGQENVIQHEKKISELKTLKEIEVKKSSELMSKLQYVMERERNAKEEVSRLDQELKQQAVDLNEKFLKERKEWRESIDDARQAKLQWCEKEIELKDKILTQNQSNRHLQCKYDECLAQLTLKQNSQSTGSERQIRQLEEDLQREIKKVKDLESRFAEHEDNMVTTKALRADLALVPSMKSELEKLRQDNERYSRNEQNTLLLEEEIRSLKSKLAHLDRLQTKTVQLEVENEELTGRLSRWEAADTSGSRRPQSPSSFARQSQELVATNASLLLEQGELQTQTSIYKRKLEQMESENNKLTMALSVEKDGTNSLNDLIKRLKRKVLLQSKEKNAYKDLLDSYESEVTVNFDAEKGKQISNLEDVIQEYQASAALTESQIEALTKQLSETTQSLYQVQQQLDSVGGAGSQQSSQEDKETILQLREKFAALENELLTIQGQKGFLEAKIEQRYLQGDYDPSKVKVLHMLNNPHAMVMKAREEELGSLKEDNDRLKKRNEILEENGGRLGDVTMRVEEKLQHPSPSKEAQELKSQLASAEMRMQRLREVFSKTSKEFREVVYTLLGYRVDIPSTNQYRLTSMYAERKKDHLLFQQNEKGEMQLLQTDFSMKFEDAMENYLKRMGSLPMFLSHITMDLFNRQTIAFG